MKLNEEQKKTAIEVLDKFSTYALIPDYILNNFKKLHNLIPTIEVGKAYKKGLARVMITREKEADGLYPCYGIDCDGDWMVKVDSYEIKGFIDKSWQPITQEEWIEALKKKGINISVKRLSVCLLG